MNGFIGTDLTPILWRVTRINLQYGLDILMMSFLSRHMEKRKSQWFDPSLTFPMNQAKKVYQFTKFTKV